MARSAKPRRICDIPKTLEFSPQKAVPCETVILTVDEYETVRLIDHLRLTQEECAAQMNVSRTTVQSIYDSARKKIADVIVAGKKLVIQGGSYELCPHSSKCCGKSCVVQKCTNRMCNSGNDACSTCSKRQDIIDICQK